MSYNCCAYCGAFAAPLRVVPNTHGQKQICQNIKTCRARQRKLQSRKRKSAAAMQP